MTDRLRRIRENFARETASAAGARDPRIEAAFAATPREQFAGPGPWLIAQGGRYVETPDDDPAHLYRNELVAIDAARGINIGEPVLHAMCLDALGLRAGETVVHVGAGVGYYTAILAQLVGPTGRVFAYEVDPAIAARAARTLAGFDNVVVAARTGIAPDLPKADAIYVNASAIEPFREWRDALKPGGRLMFPLEAPGRLGAMLLLTRPAGGGPWPARMMLSVAFIACEADRDREATRRLTEAFDRGGWNEVRSLRFDPPDENTWLAEDGWRLSSKAPDDP